MKDIFKEWSQDLCWATRGLRCWNTLTDSSNLSSWGGLDEPQSPCNPLEFCRAPRMPWSFPTLFLLELRYQCLLLRPKEEKMQGRFLFLASATVTWHRHLLFGPGPLLSSLPLALFRTPFYNYPHHLSHYRPSSRLTGVSLSVPVLRQTRRGSIATVISIRRTGLLICLPACQSACSPACLRTCLPARALPTAMPYSCPIHLLLNKRLLSSGHPSLHWPLFLHGEAQEWGLTLKGIDCWGRLSRNAWMLTLVLPSCFYSI